MDRDSERYRSGSNQSESYPGAPGPAYPGALRGGEGSYGGEPREASCNKEPGGIRQRLHEKMQLANKAAQEAQTAQDALIIIDKNPELLVLIESLQRLGMLRSY